MRIKIFTLNIKKNGKVYRKITITSEKAEQNEHDRIEEAKRKRQYMLVKHRTYEYDTELTQRTIFIK